MSTLKDPGAFDCLAKLAPDEPYFVLIGRDPLASVLVDLWADVRVRMDANEPAVKITEARLCAAQMEAWAAAHAHGDIDMAERAVALEAANFPDAPSNSLRVASQRDALALARCALQEIASGILASGHLLAESNVRSHAKQVLLMIDSIMVPFW